MGFRIDNVAEYHSSLSPNVNGHILVGVIGVEFDDYRVPIGSRVKRKRLIRVTVLVLCCGDVIPAQRQVLNYEATRAIADCTRHNSSNGSHGARLHTSSCHRRPSNAEDGSSDNSILVRILRHYEDGHQQHRDCDAAYS